jgi:predicted ester cyclase
MWFNTEFTEQGNMETFYDLVAESFINHTARPGLSKGRDGVLYLVQQVMKPAFPDLRMEMYDQIAEGDKVTSGKLSTPRTWGVYGHSGYAQKSSDGDY